MSDVDADHILAVAQIIGFLVIKIVHIGTHRHKGGIIGTGSQFLTQLYRPDHFVLLPDKVPVSSQFFVVKAAVPQEYPLGKGEPDHFLLHLLQRTDFRSGKVDFLLIRGIQTAADLLLPDNLCIGQILAQLQQTVNRCFRRCQMDFLQFRQESQQGKLLFRYLRCRYGLGIFRDGFTAQTDTELQLLFVAVFLQRFHGFPCAAAAYHGFQLWQALQQRDLFRCHGLHIYFGHIPAVAFFSQRHRVVQGQLRPLGFQGQQLDIVRAALSIYGFQFFQVFQHPDICFRQSRDSNLFGFFRIGIPLEGYIPEHVPAGQPPAHLFIMGHRYLFSPQIQNPLMPGVEPEVHHHIILIVPGQAGAHRRQQRQHQQNHQQFFQSPHPEISFPIFFLHFYLLWVGFSCKSRIISRNKKDTPEGVFFRLQNDTV